MPRLHRSMVLWGENFTFGFCILQLVHNPVSFHPKACGHRLLFLAGWPACCLQPSQSDLFSLCDLTSDLPSHFGAGMKETASCWLWCWFPTLRNCLCSKPCERMPGHIGTPVLIDIPPGDSILKRRLLTDHFVQ